MIYNYHHFVNSYHLLHRYQLFKSIHSLTFLNFYLYEIFITQEPFHQQKYARANELF